jgi:hypothetical protein
MGSLHWDPVGLRGTRRELSFVTSGQGGGAPVGFVILHKTISVIFDLKSMSSQDVLGMSVSRLEMVGSHHSG